jgi:glutaredoxin 3
MSDTNIKIYSSPTCAFCHMAMNYLKSKNIGFREIDVSTDAEAAKWVQDKVGYIATPVIDVNGTVILGFDRPALDKALAAGNITA